MHAGGYKEMSSILANQKRPRTSSPNAEGWGDCGVSANEYSCAHRVTWSPNKLRRSKSIFNIWMHASIGFGNVAAETDSEKVHE